jgi:membrane protease subunit (stomatin/prohibitin family)
MGSPTIISRRRKYSRKQNVNFTICGLEIHVNIFIKRINYLSLKKYENTIEDVNLQCIIQFINILFNPFSQIGSYLSNFNIHSFQAFQNKLIR